MKAINAAILSLSISVVAAAQTHIQESEVPTAVKESLAKIYGNPKNVKWELENGNYDAAFRTGKGEQSVVMNAQGNVIATEISMRPEDLPAIIREYIASKYPDEKIKDAQRVTDVTGMLTYEVGMKGRDLFFDANGALLREEKDED